MVGEVVCLELELDSLGCCAVGCTHDLGLSMGLLVGFCMVRNVLRRC